MQSPLPPPPASFPAAARSLGLTTVADLLTRDYPLHLVRGLLPQIGTTCAYGAPGLGKSFLALDIALSVAAGLDVLGRRALQGSAFYLSTEGKSGMRARAEAWALSRGLDIRGLPVALIEKALNLRDETTVSSLIGQLAKLEKITGVRCRFICIDTLSQCLFGDENRQEDMTEFASSTTRIANALETQVCVIHHTGKDEGKGARGSSVINGNFDTLLHLSEGSEAFELTLRTGKQKNDRKVALRIGLEEVLCGIDRDGYEVRSLAVSERSGEALDDASEPRKDARLSPAARSVIEVLAQAGPDGLDCLEWRKAAQMAGIGANRPATARDIIERLKEQGFVRETGQGRFVVA